MQPFTYKHLVVIAVSIISYFAGSYFWRMPNLYLDIAARSAITAIVYISLCFMFKISEDINDKINDTAKKFGLIH